MDTMGCFGRASTNKTCQFLAQNRWRQRFPFRIIRIFENRFTRSGAISILVEVLEFSKKKWCFLITTIIYYVGLHSKFITFCHFLMNLVVFLRSTSTKIKIAPLLVNRFSKIRMLDAGKLMYYAFLDE